MNVPGRFLAMSDIEDDLEDRVTSALGIMECLRILTAEAANLELSRTMQALRNALVTCESEGLSASTGVVMLREGTPVH